jgi:hypothetical protein
MGSETPSNYTAIKEGLSLAEPDRSTLEGLLNIALEYTSSLAKAKPDRGDEFNRYLAGAVFGRIVALNKEAEEKDIEIAFSKTLFGELKNHVYKKLSVSGEFLSDERLSNLFGECVNIFFEKSYGPEINQNLLMLRRFAAEIVPDNPKGETETAPVPTN